MSQFVVANQRGGKGTTTSATTLANGPARKSKTGQGEAMAMPLGSAGK